MVSSDEHSNEKGREFEQEVATLLNHLATAHPKLVTLETKPRVTLQNDEFVVQTSTSRCSCHINAIIISLSARIESRTPRASAQDPARSEQTTLEDISFPLSRYYRPRVVARA